MRSIRQSATSPRLRASRHRSLPCLEHPHPPGQCVTKTSRCARLLQPRAANIHGSVWRLAVAWVICCWWHQFGRRLVVPNARKARKQLVTMCSIGFWNFWQKPRDAVLDNLTLEVDALVTHAVRQARWRTNQMIMTSALTLAIDSSRAAISDRKIVLMHKASDGG